jgi:hypothetical protein
MSWPGRLPIVVTWIESPAILISPAQRSPTATWRRMVRSRRCDEGRGGEGADQQNVESARIGQPSAAVFRTSILLRCR